MGLNLDKNPSPMHLMSSKGCYVGKRSIGLLIHIPSVADD